jgi:hypothetical protein
MCQSVVQFYETSAVSHHRDLCSIPGHSVLHLYWTLWHWNGVFHEYFIVAVCIIVPMPRTNSFVTSTILCDSWQCCCITHTSDSSLSALMKNVTLHHKNTILCHIAVWLRMWCCIVVWGVCDVSKDSSAFIFRVQQSACTEDEGTWCF